MPFKFLTICVIVQTLCDAGINPTLGGEIPSSAADYPTLQAAVDDNPGKTINISSGDYLLSETLNISAENTTLQGAGRLIQQNPNAAVVRIHDCKHIRISGLTLTRSEDKQTATKPAIEVSQVEHVTLQDLRIINNHARNGAITITDCQHIDVRDCSVKNYSLISIDDRTTGNDAKLYGYAFNCIDGTGVLISRCCDVLIRGNRVI